MIKNIKLDIEFSQFLFADYNCQESSCISHQVHELNDLHQQFGGFPKSYVYENTRINQLWWNADQINFEEIGGQLGMEVITISSIRQHPGGVIPWHRDTFFQINQRYPSRNEVKVRANIFLEDWKIGHYIQYDNTVVTHWRQGQGLLWDSEVLHLGANAGMLDKFTLQISGFMLV